MNKYSERVTEMRIKNKSNNDGSNRGSLLGKVLAAVLAAEAVFLATGYPFFRFMTYAGNKKKKESDKNGKKWFQLNHIEVNHPRYKHNDEYEKTREWCESQSMEDWYIKSYDGIMLHAKYLPAENAKRSIVLSHGYRGTSFGSIAHMAQFLHENGCNLLFVDQRCCGESEGEYITFGAKEQHDIMSWMYKVIKLDDKKLPVYLFGQSMGATSVILASGHDLPEEVKGIIADCGYHSMKQQLRDISKGWFHLHWIELLLFRVDIFSRLLAGFKMKEADTTVALKNNTRPVLFFHGEKDTYVYPVNTEINYELCTAPKEVVYIPSARHLCCSYEAPKLYKKKLKEFFKKYDISNT